jgi:hypothetical protein
MPLIHVWLKSIDVEFLNKLVEFFDKQVNMESGDQQYRFVGKGRMVRRTNVNYSYVVRLAIFNLYSSTDMRSEEEIRRQRNVRSGFFAREKEGGSK